MEKAFEAACAVPLVKSAMVENEAQFTVVYTQPSVAEGKTINYATTFTDDPVCPGFLNTIITTPQAAPLSTRFRDLAQKIY